MRTSIRLLLSALLVSGITYAAAGAPILAQGGNSGGGKPAFVLASAETPANR